MSIIDSYFQNYTVNEYTNFHLKLIFLSKKSGVDIEHYLSSNFDPLQLEQIYLGLLLGLNVEKYADVNFDSEQMNEIRLGLVEGVDVDIYSTYDLSAHSMKRFRKRLSKELIIQIKSTYKEKVELQSNTNMYNIDILNDRISELKENLKKSNPLNYEEALNEEENLDIFKFNY